MKIAQLQVTITPWRIDDGYTELRVQILVDGVEHGTSEPVKTCDFESMYDMLIDRAKHRIAELIKKKNQPLPKFKPQ